MYSQQAPTHRPHACITHIHIQTGCWPCRSQTDTQGIVLVLAGVELIFFIVASMGLCFGFICVGNSVGNTGMFQLLLSSAYTASRPFLLLTPPHQGVGWGCTRSWEGTQLGQLTPTDQRDIPYHMYDVMLSNKSWGKKEERGDIGSDGVCLPK